MKTKTDAKHTTILLPIVSKQTYDSPDGRHLFDAIGNHVASWVKPDHAEFIVRAVNSHEALLEALREIRGGKWTSAKWSQEIAAKAIDKAEGGL